MTRVAPRMAALGLLLALLGCGENEGLEPAEPTAVPEKESLAHEEIDRLRALGYVGFAEEKVDPEAPSVRVYDPERSEPGINLIANRDLSSAQLIAATGEVLHEWHDLRARHWANAELLPNGDLLVPGSLREERSNFLLRLDWDGNEVWRSRISAHHDVEQMPDGRIATLTVQFRRMPEISEEFDIKDHKISILSQEGKLLEEESLYDLLASAPEVFHFQPVRSMDRNGPAFIDLLHANSLEFMAHPKLGKRDALYGAHNVIVSLRHQDTVAIFDWQARRLLWAWGQGELSGQHDATVLPNGNILIFDNGLDRSWTRIIELNPLSNEIVWDYHTPDPKDFFSLRKGSSQRLLNGNTLIANSDSGEAFEVTRQGEVVWHFVNPLADLEGNRATIVRVKRYPLEMFSSLLKR